MKSTSMQQTPATSAPQKPNPKKLDNILTGDYEVPVVEVRARHWGEFGKLQVDGKSVPSRAASLVVRGCARDFVKLTPGDIHTGRLWGLPVNGMEVPLYKYQQPITRCLFWTGPTGTGEHEEIGKSYPGATLNSRGNPPGDDGSSPTL